MNRGQVATRTVHGNARCDSLQPGDQGVLYTPEVQGKGIEGSDRGLYAKAENDPKPTDQDRPAMDNKMSVLSCAQNALDEFPSARLSLARLCPHRALFSSTVRVSLEHTEGDKSMIFRAYASENPGVWGGPQGTLKTQLAITEIANLQFCDSAIDQNQDRR